MYQCPVCNAASKTIRCSGCGFDISRDHITYPTLAVLPESARSISQVQKQQEQNFHCPGCYGDSFTIDWLTHEIRCGSCGMIQGSARLLHQAGEMVDVTACFAGKTVTMRSVQNGKYLCADSNIKNTPLMASRDIASHWETFVISPMTDDGWIGIRAHNGKYLTTSSVYRAANGKLYTITSFAADSPIKAQRKECQAQEHFRIFRKNHDFYLKYRFYDKWLSVRINADGVPIQACADAASDWERIEIEIIDN